jgi:hypothetical protein
MINPYVLHQLGKERHNAYLKEAESYRKAGLAKREVTAQSPPLKRSLARSIRQLISLPGNFVNRDAVSPIEAGSKS